MLENIRGLIEQTAQYILDVRMKNTFTVDLKCNTLKKRMKNKLMEFGMTLRRVDFGQIKSITSRL